MSKRKTNPTGQFLRSMDRLQAAFRANLDNDAVNVYWHGLDDVEPARLDSAVDVAIRTSQWLPKVAELRRFANEVPESSRPQYVNGEPVYRCGVCCDGGTVAIWHPDTVRAILDCRKVVYWTAVVACTCQAGDRWARERILASKRWHPLPRYDEKRMRRPQFVFEKEGTTHLAITGRFGEREKADLEAWIDEQEKIENHPNYTDFGDYSHEQQETF